MSDKPTLGESVSNLGTNLGEAASDVVDVYNGLQDARDQAYAAIGTAVLAPAMWAGNKYYEENRESIDSDLAAINTTATHVRDGASNISNAAGQKAGEIKDGTLEIVSEVGDGLGSAARTAREAVGNKVIQAKDGAAAFGNAAVEKGGEIKDNVVDTGTRIGQGIGNIASQVRQGAESAATATRDAAVETGTRVRNHVERRPVTAAVEIILSPFLPGLFISDAMTRGKSNQ